MDGALFTVFPGRVNPNRHEPKKSSVRPLYWTFIDRPAKGFQAELWTSKACCEAPPCRAVSLRVKAIESGFSVVCLRLHAMHKDAEVPPSRLWGKSYMKAASVIIDEAGFETFTRGQARRSFSERDLIMKPSAGRSLILQRQSNDRWHKANPRT
jgi:hypothetical protein